MRILVRLAFVTPFLAVSPAIRAQLEITAPEMPVTEDFDLPGTSACTAPIGWTDNGTLPNCYSDRPVFYYSNGCANIGGLHVAGTGGEMALGGRGSNSTTQVRWGVRFRNSTGLTLGALHIRARSEQWGQAASDLADNTVPFAYRTSSTPITDLTSGSYTNNTTWDLVSVTPPGGCSGANTAIDGNANGRWMEGCLNVTLAPGDEIMLRWFDTNDPCNDHMLCVDDLTVTGLLVPAITGPVSACAGTTVTLNATGGTDLQWSTGATTPGIDVLPGIYTVTVNSSCGPLTATHTVAEEPLPMAIVSPAGPVQLCEGATLVLQASGGTAYTWSTGADTSAITVTGPGTYTVTVANNCGEASASVEVEASQGPTATLTASGPILCPGGQVHLEAGGGGTYLWSTGESGSTITVLASGTYGVTVSNTCGSDVASITIGAGVLPDAAILPAGPLTICAGDSVPLTASGGETYQWSTGDTSPSIVAPGAGTYSVTVGTVCGTATASITIVGSVVDAAFSASPLTGNAPLDVAFTNESSPGDAWWDLGNGTSAEPSPITTYTEEGIYPVLLTVTNALGCTDTATAFITVLPGDAWINVPNVFTPNGDAMNDRFRMDSQGITAFDCLLFNRWGKEVGHLSGVEQGWDGRTNGEDLAAGVYYYLIKAQGVDGRSFDLKGEVTLLR